MRLVKVNEFQCLNDGSLAGIVLSYENIESRRKVNWPSVSKAFKIFDAEGFDPQFADFLFCN